MSKKYLLLLLLPVMGILISCQKGMEEKTPSLPPAPPMVQTRLLSELPTVTLSEVGTVKALQEVEIISKAAGTISDLPATLGQRVDAGTVLGLIDADEQDNVARVNLNTAASQLANARQNYEQTLANHQDSVRRAALRVEGLEDSLQKAQRNLEELKKTNTGTLKTLELQLENAEKTAQNAELNEESTLDELAQSRDDFYTDSTVSLDSVFVNLNAYYQTVSGIVNPENVSTVVISSFSRFLGVRDSLHRNQVINIYNRLRADLKKEQDFYQASLPLRAGNVENVMQRTTSMVEQMDALLSQMRTLIDNSTPGSDLTQTMLDAHETAIVAAQAGILKDIAAVNGIETAYLTLRRSQSTQGTTLSNTSDIAANQLADARNALEKFRTSGPAAERDLQAAIEQLKRDLALARTDYDSAARTRDIQNSAKELELSTLQDKLTLAQRSLDDNAITTPISGVVSSLMVDAGDYVTPGILIAKVIQHEEVKVVFYFTEDIAQRMKIGMPVSLSTPGALSSFEGQVSKIAPAADPLNRKIRIEAVVKNPGFALKPESFVNVRVDVSDTTFDPDIIYIPLNAIIVGQNEKYVYVAQDNAAVKRVIQIGRIVDKWVEVTQGLLKQEVIIVAGQRSVTEGETVRVTDHLF